MKIVAAAYKIKDKIYTLPSPNRHHNILKIIPDIGYPRFETLEEAEGGFLTDTGEWLGGVGPRNRMGD